MSSKAAVPDAWDEDWESAADKQEKVDPPKPKKLSQKERRAQHTEFNKQIWQSAENPEPLMFLEARDTVPVKSTFKPAVTVLSRKPPAPKVLARSGAAGGMAGLNLEDDDDSEEERRKKAEQSFAERKAKAEREREEKERRYAEAREKLFGPPTPNSDDIRGRASPSKHSRGKARGRGGRDSQTRSSNEQSPAGSANSRRLYDPSYTPKPNSTYIQMKESSNSRPGTPNGLSQPIREPRGPQAIGRGGNGFAPRGGRSGAAV